MPQYMHATVGKDDYYAWHCTIHKVTVSASNENSTSVKKMSDDCAKPNPAV